MSVFSVLLLSIIVTGALSIVYYTLRCSISPMPTSGKINLAILAEIKKYQSGDVVMDIGSGWGTLACSISKEFPSKTVVGIERSPVPYLFSKILNRLFCSLNCRFEYNDFFKGSFSEADVMVCYLCPSLMMRLVGKFENELKEGAVVISSTFAIPGWRPVKTIQIDDLYRSKVYVYHKNSGRGGENNETV